MERLRFSDRQLTDLIMRVNGEIEPIGETNTDKERFSNLIRLQNTLDLLLEEMLEVCRYQDRPEVSMSDAGKYALDWITDIQEWLNASINSIKTLSKPEDKQDLGDNNE